VDVVIGGGGIKEEDTGAGATAVAAFTPGLNMEYPEFGAE